MNQRAVCILRWGVGLCFLTGCAEAKKPSKSPAPAKVERLPKETELAQITLTAKAKDRLGIQTVPVERKDVPRYRHLNGEVVIPAGKTVLVSAPLTGTLSRPENGSVPIVGTRLDRGDHVFTLTPLLSPERYVPTPAERLLIANAKASIYSLQIVAEGDVRQSQAQVDATKIAHRRAVELLQERVGSARDRDDALAALTLAQRALEAAKLRRDKLMDLEVDPKIGQADPIELTSPRNGTLYRLLAAEGQKVATGGPLFEITDLDTVWIRVPIYVGDQRRLTLDANAEIRELNADAREKPRFAKPIQAPPSADPLAVTSDWYFELANREQPLRPGERVRVSIPMSEKVERLVVPWSAILYDVDGGTWVYVDKGNRVYHRERVQVRFVEKDLAILDKGPPPKTPVVIEGAPELFGTEFEGAK